MARRKYRYTNYGRFKNGVTLAGIPTSTPEGGRVFWVDSNGDGTPGTAGTVGQGSWEYPFATLDAALGACTNDKGDVIFIKPKHAENIAAAGSITCDKSGVYIIGLGIYDQRPKFTWTATASTWLFTAADVWVENLVFESNFADVTLGVDMQAKGGHLIGCTFEAPPAGALNFLTCVDIGGATDNAADGCVVAFNEWHSGDAEDLMAISITKEADDVKIVGNKIYGAFDSGTKNAIDAAAAEVCLNLLVADNLIYSTLNAAASGITVDNTASTGWIVGNFVQHLDTGGETPFVGGQYVGMFENYASGIRGTKSGYILPARDA